MFHFLRAIIFEIDDYPPGARLGNDSVERNHHDTGIDGLLDRTIQGIWWGCIDNDCIIALKNQILNLCCLSRDLLVSGSEHIGSGNDTVSNRLLRYNVVTL